MAVSFFTHAVVPESDSGASGQNSTKKTTRRNPFRIPVILHYYAAMCCSKNPAHEPLNFWVLKAT